MFVLPLVKPGGAFFTLALQCQMPFVLFTSLEEFRRCRESLSLPAARRLLILLLL
jgi:hypothetical protein